MPAIRVTIDYMDGSTKVSKPMWPDEINLHSMLLKLSEGEIAGVTFTRADPLTYIRKKTVHENPKCAVEGVTKP